MNGRVARRRVVEVVPPVGADVVGGDVLVVLRLVGGVVEDVVPPVVVVSPAIVVVVSPAMVVVVSPTVVVVTWAAA